MQKNVMTTVSESLHASLMKQANNEGVSLREYLRKVLQNDINRHQIAKQADKVLFNSDAQLNDPLFAMNISPEAAYRKLIVSNQYNRSEIDLIVANLLIKQQQLVMQRITTVGKQFDPEINDIHESFLNKLQTKAKFSSRPWDPPVEVLFDQRGKAVPKEDFAKEVMFDEPDEAIHNKLVDALAIIRCYYGIDQINHGQFSITLAMIDDDTEYWQGDRPYVNLLAPVNSKAWHEIQQTVLSSR